MAGGSGTRLRPLTCGRPKPIVPIVNKPVMEYTIELLKEHGIREIGVTLQYLPDMIKNTFGDGSELGVKIEYFIEDTPLGTAGSVKNAESFLDDTFVVISGDALTDINITEAIEYHKNKKSIATLILKEVNVPLEYGVVVTDSDGKIRRFLEKPSWSEVFSNTVNTGIYILEPEVLSCFDKGVAFDFSKDLFPLLMQNKKPLYGYSAKDYWCDIGDIQSYIQSHFDVLDGKVKVKLKEKEARKGVFVGSGVEIHPDVVINGPVVIGDNCKISKGVTIDAHSVIAENVVLHNNCSVKRSIVWKNSSIGAKSHLRGSILCYRTNLKSNVSIYEQAVIGDDTQIKERAIVKPNVKIWPHKVVEVGTVVSDNLIWGTRYSKVLFGKNGVSGDINIELTPEFASKLGTAFGSVHKIDSRICVSSDDSSAAQMIKHSIISGCISSGLEVYEIGNTVMPITRNLVSFLNLDGGIHIKLNKDSNSKVNIKFIDKNGVEISKALEKKMENAFITGDFRRCEYSRLKHINSLNDYNYFYLQNLINSVNSRNIRNSGITIIVGQTTKFIQSMLKQIFSELKCNLVNESGFNDSNISELAEEVVNTKADLGIVIDSSGEKLILVDDKGRIVDNELYVALTSIISLKMSITKSVVVPITAPNAMETLAIKYNTKVVRTKTARQEIMDGIVKDRNQKAVNGFYILSYDALASLVKILDYISMENIKLSEVIETIPNFYITKKAIDCPWDAKGKVMRSLIQEKSDSQIELYEGVKIFDEKGWVLVLPDADEPVCTIYSEGSSKELAETLSNVYVDKIRNIITS